MDSINLELILEPVDYSLETISLPVAITVQKYTEQFIYTNTIRDTAIPIAYLSNPSPDSWKNLVIVNKSGSVIANSPRLLAHEKKLDSVISTSYSSAYSNILATNQTMTDSSGKERALFYRHILPDDSTEATVTIVKNGNKEILEEGYLIDLDSNSIYTNYVNWFDPDSGSYRLYYVSASAQDGTVQNTLLNSAPATREASWEDIDLDTGELLDTYPLFSKERSGSGWTYYFNSGSRWFIKPQEIGLIQPRKPLHKRPDGPWYIRFSNGDISTVANNMVRRYRIPEYNTQPFIPYAPIKFGTKEDLLIVSRRVVMCTRKSLSIDPDSGLHIEIHAEDEDGNLVSIFTTDQALDGIRYSDTDVFYESDKIQSWDNEHGFIHLAVDIFPNYSYWAKLYYKADDYEYTLVNLNPITNRRMRDHTYVFYCVPDVNDSDRAIHYLLVGPDGTIKDTSQNLGLGHPSLQLKLLDGSFNSGTVVGLPYNSDTTDCFLSKYAAGYANTFAYMVLAEVSAIDVSILEDQIYVDVRRPGAVIKPELFTEAIRDNPRILQSILGYGENGQTVPEVNVVVLEPPLTLLEDYGGDFTIDQAEAALKTHLPVSGHAVIEWDYPRTTISATSFTTSQVALTLTWEGNYTHKLYRKQSEADAWDLIHSTAVATSGRQIDYVDTTAITDIIYQYAASLADDINEYPLSNILSIKVT